GRASAVGSGHAISLRFVPAGRPGGRPGGQNGKPWAWGRAVTHRYWVNSSPLLWEPNRLPLPEAPVPPNGAYASLFSVWSLTCTIPAFSRSAISRPRFTEPLF